METYYLIDYENVHEEGLKGIDALTGSDHVCLMYTPNAAKISLDILAGIKADFRVIKASAGKQSLDMHIATFMGFLVGANIEKKAEYVIISKDTDFDSILRFWNSGEVGSFSRRPSIAWSPDEEEEKPAKAQPKKSAAAKKRDNKSRNRNAAKQQNEPVTEEKKIEAVPEAAEIPVTEEKKTEAVPEAAEIPVTEEKKIEAVPETVEIPVTETFETAKEAAFEEKTEAAAEPAAEENGLFEAGNEPASEEKEDKSEAEAVTEEDKPEAEAVAEEEKPETEAMTEEDKPEAEVVTKEETAKEESPSAPEEKAETAAGEEKNGNKTPKRKKRGPGRPKNMKNTVNAVDLPEEAKADASDPKPVSDKTQLNNRLVRVLRDAQVESTTAQQVASIVVSNMDKKNIKQVSYREIIKKFGQKSGLEYYGLIKKEI